MTADDGHLPGVIDQDSTISFFDLPVDPTPPDLDPPPPPPDLDPTTFRLTPAQNKALDMITSDATHCALGGGARSGKTALFIICIITRALKSPYSRHAIFRFRLNALISSVVLDTLPKMMRLAFPGLWEKCKLNRQDNYLQLHNGSEIWFAGLDDKDRTEKILGMEFCIDPDSKLLKSDLTWVKASEVSVNDELIGFPEDLEGHQKLEPSVVQRADIQIADKYLIKTNKGQTIVSANHGFVGYFDDRRTKNFRYLSWVKAKDLKVGDCIRFACDPWEVENDRDAGWLAGMYDGEGWLNKNSNGMGTAQRKNEAHVEIERIMRKFNLVYHEYAQKNEGYDDCHQFRTTNMWDMLRILGKIRPYRFNHRTSSVWHNRRAFVARDSSSGYGTGRTPDPAGRHVAEIVSIEYLGKGPVVALGTSTRTFIADGFLGHNCTLYFNECSQIPYSSVTIALTRLAQKTQSLNLKAYYDFNPPSKVHWTYLQFVANKNPENKRDLKHPQDYRFYLINPHDNIQNLDQKYIDMLDSLNEKARNRFLLGKFADEADGQLFTEDVFAVNRILGRKGEIPEFLRVVVAVDPSGCSGQEDKRSDEVGIAVGALGVDGKGYLLEDLSGKHSPEQWSQIVNDAYTRHNADIVVAEGNFGGDMVRAVLQAKNPDLPFKEVTASRGKVVRAEPFSTLYQRGRIHHVGYYPELEDQLCGMTTSGYQGLRSPDRADACLIGSTLVTTLRGDIPINEVTTDDHVLTRSGFFPVEWSGMTKASATVFDIELSNNTVITATAEHPFYCPHIGWVSVDSLTIGMVLYHITESMDYTVWHSKKSSSMVRRIVDTLKVWIKVNSGTTSARPERDLKPCTEQCGSFITEAYRKITTFITSMVTGSTTTSPILNVSHQNNTVNVTQLESVIHGCEHISNESDRWRLNGTARRKELSGISRTDISVGKDENHNSQSNVSSVIQTSRHSMQTQSVVVNRAITDTSKQLINTTFKYLARTVRTCFGRTSTNSSRKPVHVSVVQVTKRNEQPVYNIHVDGPHEFFANSVLVHNCIWLWAELFPGMTQSKKSENWTPPPKKTYTRKATHYDRR